MTPPGGEGSSDATGCLRTLSCGSGKKLKFCCLAISSDMEKIEKLIDNHQPRMALQSLEKVAKKHGDNPWV